MVSTLPQGTFPNGSISSEHAEFISSQIDTEVKKGQYFEDFGPDLLPGMYSSPIHAMPKPGTETF